MNPPLNMSARHKAKFSPCRRFRYSWKARWESGKLLNFLLLNPSTADEFKSDPTVSRCIEHAKRMDMPGVVVTNIFAFRATDPIELRRAIARSEDVVGEENDRYILRMARNAAKVIVGYGNNGEISNRGKAVVDMLSEDGIPLFFLGSLTQKGNPRHPLYLKYTTSPILWRRQG